MKKKNKYKGFRIGLRGRRVLVAAAIKLGVKNADKIGNVYLVQYCLDRIGSDGGQTFQDDFAIIDQWLSEHILEETEKPRKPKVVRKKCAVYALREPGSEEVRYVGQTTTRLSTRLKYHLKAVGQKERRNQRLSPVQRWISKCLKSGIVPEMVMLQEKAQWDISEAAWIERMAASGDRLLNVASRIPGGAR